jgi:hypothetical protein
MCLGNKGGITVKSIPFGRTGLSLSPGYFFQSPQPPSVLLIRGMKNIFPPSLWIRGEKGKKRSSHIQWTSGKWGNTRNRKKK